MAIVISGVNNNDKITASDGTIDLLSGVSYAGIITAPAFTTPGNLTAGHLNIGSGIQLGNAGIATATTFVGNLTGNVNATSNLLLQIGGSEKFRVASSGQLGIGGANYGTSGQVLTSGGSGSAATWSTITGTTINNNAANRIITGEGGTTLNGEANLTYDGSTLAVAGTIAMTGGALKLDSHPLVTTANFTGISGGAYAARLGSTGSSTIRSTQIYGGGNVLATFDGVNNRLGIGTEIPSQKIHIKDSTQTMIQIESSSYSSYVGTAQANDNIGNGSKAGNLVLRGQTGVSIMGNNGTTTQVKIDADGLKFGNATAAANALDSYEEGTFTPTVLNGWGILNSNPQISTGKYIRIGAIVYIYFTFKEGSGTGASFNGNRLALYTFPFNPDGTFGSGGGNNFTHPLQAYTNSNSSNGENVIGVPGSNGATVFSYITKASNGYGSFTGNDLSSSGTIFCAGTYRITGT